MAGPLGILSTSSGGMLGNAMATIDSARPHILADLMKSTGVGGSSLGSSLSSLTSILTDRPTIFKNRMATVQSAPTIVDKIKAAVEPPTTAAPAAPAKEYTPPMRQLASGSTVEVLKPPSNITFR